MWDLEGFKPASAPPRRVRVTLLAVLALLSGLAPASAFHVEPAMPDAASVTLGEDEWATFRVPMGGVEQLDVVVDLHGVNATVGVGMTILDPTGAHVVTRGWGGRSSLDPFVVRAEAPGVSVREGFVGGQTVGGVSIAFGCASCHGDHTVIVYVAGAAFSEVRLQRQGTATLGSTGEGAFVRTGDDFSGVDAGAASYGFGPRLFAGETSVTVQRGFVGFFGHLGGGVSSLEVRGPTLAYACPCAILDEPGTYTFAARHASATPSDIVVVGADVGL